MRMSAILSIAKLAIAIAAALATIATATYAVERSAYNEPEKLSLPAAFAVSFVVFSVVIFIALSLFYVLANA